MIQTVFFVQHLHTLSDGCEDIKSIGVYSSRQLALEAVERAMILPGFKDFPKLIDPSEDDDVDGFYFDECTLDEDNWTEGFVTE
ncbi:MAG: serine kinase [bacterium]